MVDQIKAACPSCAHTLRVPAAFAGRKARCPQCQSIITIPLNAPASETTITKPSMDVDIDQTRIAPPPFEPQEMEAPTGPEPEAPTEPEPEPEPEPDEPEPVVEKKRTSSHERRRSGSSIRPAATDRRRGSASGVHKKGYTTRTKRPASSSRWIPMVIAAVLVAGGLGALAYIAFSGKEELPVAKEPSATGKPSPTAAATPDVVRAQIEARIREFITIYNVNDIDRLRDLYHSATKAEMNHAFSDVLWDSDLKYENFTLVSIDPESGVARFKVDRVLTNRKTKEKKTEAVEKSQKWKQVVKDRWVLESKPEI